MICVCSFAKGKPEAAVAAAIRMRFFMNELEAVFFLDLAEAFFEGNQRRQNLFALFRKYLRERSYTPLVACDQHFALVFVN
jgi:hypothetical protein